MANLEAIIDLSIQEALHGRSKVTPQVLGIIGMFSHTNKHLFNNICARIDDCVHLTVGAWRGASLLSAQCGNVGQYIGIDNWSQFTSEEEADHKDPRVELFDAIKKCDGKVNIIEGDCFSNEVFDLVPNNINFLFYDADHDEKCQHDAPIFWYPKLADRSIYVVDDWDWDHVRKGTMEGLSDAGLKILYQKELPGSLWHNGLSIFVVDK